MKNFGVAIFLTLGVISTPAFALTCSGSGHLFTMAAGTISTPGYTGDAASACITVGSGLITVALSNDTASITNVPQLLDGFSFSLGGAGAVTSLTGVSATDAVDCTDTSTCTAVGAINFDADGGGGFTGSISNFYWGLSLTSPTFYGSGCTSSVNLSGTSPGFFAGQKSGCFALEPGAIVNSGVLGTSPNGLTNGPHNDLLLGPVTFTFACPNCNADTRFSNAVWYWGTDGQHNGGSVPEPTSILLLGTAVAFAGKLLSRRLSV